MKKIFPLLILFSYTFSQKAIADLKVSNNSGVEIFLAFGYIENGHHISKGWTRLKDGETKILITGNNLKNEYYYYATGTGIVRKGSEEFYIDDKDFSFYDQNSQLGKGQKIGFKKEDLGTGVINDYTIKIKPTVAESFIIKKLRGAPGGDVVKSQTNKL